MTGTVCVLLPRNYCCTPPSSSDNLFVCVGMISVSFQVHLYENSTAIDMVYRNLTTHTSSISNGASQTIGIAGQAIAYVVVAFTVRCCDSLFHGGQALGVTACIRTTSLLSPTTLQCASAGYVSAPLPHQLTHVLSACSYCTVLCCTVHTQLLKRLRLLQPRSPPGLPCV